LIEGYAIIREAAHEAADAAETALEGLREGRVQDEEAFTGQMIGAIEDRFRNLRTKGVSWTAMVLTAHQRSAQETEFGADLMGVLQIDLPDFSVRKGFLAQAKLMEPGQYVAPADRERLLGQCERMLTHSPDSFVFLYGRRGIFVVPAISVLGLARHLSLHDLYKRRIARFFEEHFESFIGDRRIFAPDIRSLKALQEQMAARCVLILKGGMEGIPQKTD